MSSQPFKVEAAPVLVETTNVMVPRPGGVILAPTLAILALFDNGDKIGIVPKDENDAAKILGTLLRRPFKPRTIYLDRFLLIQPIP